VDAIPPLPNEAFVLRAGIMYEQDLMNNVLDHYDKVLEEEGREEWALSVHSLPDLGINAIARRAGKRHRCMKVSRVGFLRMAGLEVRPDGRPDGHSNILLKGEPILDDLIGIRRLFGRAMLNAGREKKEGESRRCDDVD
jgi:hypothetical protein